MIQQDKGHAFVLFVVAAGHAGQIKGLVRWDHVAKPQQGDTGLRGVVGHFPFRESVAHDHVMDGHQRLWWTGVVGVQREGKRGREKCHWCEYESQSGPVVLGVDVGRPQPVHHHQQHQQHQQHQLQQLVQQPAQQQQQPPPPVTGLPFQTRANAPTISIRRRCICRRHPGWSGQWGPISCR